MMKRGQVHLIAVGIALSALTLLALPLAAQPVLEMSPTLEAALGQPRVHVQLYDAEARALTPLRGRGEMDALGLGQLTGDGPQHWFMAYLDTGASAYVLSRATARRFGVSLEPEAVYHEAALHGEVPMSVSRRYRLGLSGAGGSLEQEPSGPTTRSAAPVRFQVTQSDPQGMMAMMGEVNVIGMPAIQHLVVEVDPPPTGAAGGDRQAMLRDLGRDLGIGDLSIENLSMAEQLIGGPAVTLHPPNHRPPAQSIDAVVPLQMRAFSRFANPADRGPKPDLAANPMVVGVQTSNATGRFVGDWLLDTGAAASIISTRHAEALGLVRDGSPTRPADFTLPIGGISGGVTRVPGFTIDRLAIRTTSGQLLVYRDVHVLVHDVGTELDDGSHVTLDGILGMNLFMPTAAGFTTGLPTETAPAPVERFWIDASRSQLLLDLPEALR